MTLYRTLFLPVILLALIGGCTHMNKPAVSEEEKYGLELDPRLAEGEPVDTVTDTIETGNETKAPANPEPRH